MTQCTLIEMIPPIRPKGCASPKNIQVAIEGVTHKRPNLYNKIPIHMKEPHHFLN